MLSEMFPLLFMHCVEAFSSVGADPGNVAIGSLPL